MGTGKIILRSGLGWTLLAQLGQLKMGLDGKGLLYSHLWCPNNLTRLWDTEANLMKFAEG